MPRIKLTKSAIDALPTPTSDVVYWDAGFPGFGVKVTPIGRKVFHDVYRCPGGTARRTTGTFVNDGTTMLYTALQRECAACALKSRSCPNTPARKVPRSIHEGARDMARQIARSREGGRLDGYAKRSRCCSLTSSASSSSIGCD
jgi:hypothetical protein